MIDINQINFSKLDGLVPAIIIDYRSQQVLMLGFMNKDSLKTTIEKKRITFWSRSKKRLWEKGETSGNYLEPVEIVTDCDNDSLLIVCKPAGNTCHTGNYSCFNLERDNIHFLNQLFKLIQNRKKELPEKSYTAELFRKGSDRIIQKVGEEAVETVIAAKNSDKKELINEISDLVFHLFVMMTEKDINLDDIMTELIHRHQN